MTKSAHTAHCQACGRIQAVHINTGMIAKHGYTTDYGFFNGTCGGSDHLPLQIDTVVNVGTVKAMNDFAAKQEAVAAGDITKVQVEVGSKYVGSRRVAETKMMDRAEFVATQPRYADFDQTVELVRYSLRRLAKSIRQDAEQLDALRGKVFGTAMIERAVEAPIKREYFKTYREAYARVEALKAEGFKAQQRRAHGSITVTYR